MCDDKPSTSICTCSSGGGGVHVCIQWYTLEMCYKTSPFFETQQTNPTQPVCICMQWLFTLYSTGWWAASFHTSRPVVYTITTGFDQTWLCHLSIYITLLMLTPHCSLATPHTLLHHVCKYTYTIVNSFSSYPVNFATIYGIRGDLWQWVHVSLKGCVRELAALYVCMYMHTDQLS